MLNMYLQRELMHMNMSRPADMPAVKAVLWDIDGTLIDSAPLHCRIITGWCLERGYHLNDDDVLLLQEKTLREKWNILRHLHQFQTTFSLFSQEYRIKYSQCLRWEMRRKGPVEAFKRVAALGLPQVCVSNADSHIVRTSLQMLELEKMVLFSITAEKVNRGKPHPDPYLLAREQLGLDPGECLAVEDSPSGIRSAVSAGIPAVAWPLTRSNRNDYHGVDYWVNFLADFPWTLLRRSIRNTSIRN